MSFANEVKEEILSHDYTREHFIAFIHGIFNSGLAKIIKNDETNIIEIRASSSPLTRKIIKFFKSEYNSIIDLAIRQNLIKKTKIFIIKIYNVNDFIADFSRIKLDLVDTSKTKDKHSKNNLTRAYFCGLFSGCGSVNSPSTSNYHLELTYSQIELASQDLNTLNSFGFNFKLYTRSVKRTIIYIKKSILVSDFLKFLDVPNSVLKFEQIRIQRDFKNSQNRIINIETSNQVKVLRTGKRQIEDITFLVNNNIFNNLPKNTQLLLYERLKNDSATYDELCEILNKKGIKISKPTVGGIFTKIKKLVEKEKENDI